MNHPSNENIPSRSFSYHAFNFTFLLILAVFFISLYTVALLKSNSRITLSAAVERNISCSDAVHRAISSRLTRADFEQINTKSDMRSAQYRSLQSYLNEFRSLNSTRYLYTAKRGTVDRLNRSVSVFHINLDTEGTENVIGSVGGNDRIAGGKNMPPCGINDLL